LLAAFLLLFISGCSPRASMTGTPVVHAGTPTNRASVNSTDLYREPFYTQPGVNSGKPFTLKPIASQRGFEPNDPLAEAVYAALVQNGELNKRYFAVSAKDGVVKLVGSVSDKAQKAAAESTARAVPGVKRVLSELTVQ